MTDPNLQNQTSAQSAVQGANNAVDTNAQGNQRGGPAFSNIQAPQTASQKPYVDPTQIPDQAQAQNTTIPEAPVKVDTGAKVEGMENPFVPPSDPPAPKASVAIKKILAVIVLIVVAIGLLYFIFSVAQRALKKNEKVSLIYWGLWEEDVVMQSLIDSYQNENPNVTITYIKESPRQYRERLLASMEKGTGPDVFRFHNTWLPMMQGILEPAPESVISVAEFEKTFYPVAKDNLVLNNEIYGVPLEIDGLALFYNKDLFRAAGVSPPRTWEDLQDAAQKITVKDASGKIVTAGAALGTTGNIEHFSDIVAMMIMQNGADLKNPVSTEAQQALAFYRLFAEEPNNVWDDRQDNSIYAFANNRVGMIMAPSWQVHTILEINKELEFGVVPLPQLPGANVAWASYWAEGVSKNTANPEAAWQFLSYLSSYDALVQLYTVISNNRLFGEPYSRRDLAGTIKDDPYIGAYVQQAELMRSFPLASRTFDNGLNDRMIKYLEDAVNSLGLGVAPDEAVETMAVGFDQVFSDFGLTAGVY